MPTMLNLSNHKEILNNLHNEFWDSPIGRKISIHDDTSVRVYFERFLHNRVKEFGRGVYYQKSGSKHGFIHFPDDNDFILFKLTYI